MTTLTIKPTSAGNDIQIKSGSGVITHATFGDTSTATLDTATITNATIADATITAGTFPAGHILKVVGDNYTTNLVLTTSYVDILQVDIIPTSSSSRFIIMANIATNHASSTSCAGMLVRTIGATEALNYEVADYYNPSGSGISGNISIIYYDIPNTTTSIEYKIQAKEELGSGELNKDYNGTVNGVCSLIVQEIQG